MRAALAITAVFLLVGPSSALAGDEYTGFVSDPPPAKCGAGEFSGCYADGNPALMDDTNAADVTVSPHIARAGQTITARISPGAAHYTWNWPIGSCDDTSTTCTFTASRTPASGPLTWQRLSVSGSIGCCGWVEQDYYAVSGPNEHPIQGNVAEFDPTGTGGDRPSAKVRVRVSGPQSKTLTTNVAGDFGDVFEAGSYTVEVLDDGYCDRTRVTEDCPRTIALTVGDTARNASTTGRADFYKPQIVRLEGVVKEKKDPQKPVAGVPISTKDGRKTTVTNSEGRYQLKLVRGTHTIVTGDPTVCTTPEGVCQRQVTHDLTKALTIQDWTRRGKLHDLTVRAQDATGGPLEHVEFRVEKDGGRTDETGPDGSAVFEDIEEGATRVFAVNAPGAEPVASADCVAIPAVKDGDGRVTRGAGCEVQLDAAKTVTFTVRCGVDPRNIPQGKPLDQTGGAPPTDAVYSDVSTGALQAVGCFRKDSTSRYATELPFRMNGVDVVPLKGVTVYIDTLQSLVYTTDAFQFVKLYFGSLPVWIGPIRFPFTTAINTRLEPASLFKDSPPFDLGGLLVSPTLAFSSGGGASNLSLNIQVPIRGQYKKSIPDAADDLDPNITDKAAVSGTVEIKGTNKDGSSLDKASLGIEGDNGKDAIKFGSGAALTKALFVYDHSKKQWGGDAELKLTAGRFNGVKLAAGARWGFGENVPPLLDALPPVPPVLALRSLANLEEVTFSAKGINQGPFGPGFFFQDIGGKMGFDDSKPVVPFRLEANAAISWLPKLSDGQLVTTRYSTADGGTVRGEDKSAFAGGLAAALTPPGGSTPATALLSGLSKLPGFERVKRIFDFTGKLSATWDKAGQWPLMELSGDGTFLKDHPYLQAKLGKATLRMRGLAGEWEFDIGASLPGGYVAANGRLKGWVTFNPANFYSEGEANVKLFGVAGRGQMSISPAGEIFCLLADLPGAGRVGVGAALDFQTGEVLRFGGECDVGRFGRAIASPLSASAAAAGTPVTVAGGQRFALFRVTGAGSAPKLVLRGPRGRTVRATRAGRRGSAVVFVDPEKRTTYVLVARPAAGTWRATRTGGGRLTGISVAGPRPQAAVSGRLLRGRGGRCTGRLAVTARGASAPLLLHDAGPANRAGLGQVRTRATLRLPAAASDPGDHTVLAVPSDLGGAAGQTTVARYAASAAGLVAAPDAVRVRRAGAARRVTWSRTCGARRYLVRAGRTTTTTSGTSADVGRTGTVTVTAIAADGTRSPAVKP